MNRYDIFQSFYDEKKIYTIMDSEFGLLVHIGCKVSSMFIDQIYHTTEISIRRQVKYNLVIYEILLNMDLKFETNNPNQQLDLINDLTYLCYENEFISKIEQLNETADDHKSVIHELYKFISNIFKDNQYNISKNELISYLLIISLKNMKNFISSQIDQINYFMVYVIMIWN